MQPREDPHVPSHTPPSCAFFPGAIERPPGGLLPRGGLRPVTVAVGLEGVTIIDPRQKVRGGGQERAREWGHRGGGVTVGGCHGGGGHGGVGSLWSGGVTMGGVMVAYG